MLAAAQIPEWVIIDLSRTDPESVPPCEHGLCFGSVCARLVTEYVVVDKLYTFPALSSLEPRQENKATRARAWALIQEVKRELDGEVPKDEGNGGDGFCVILKVDDKRICVYDGKKPDDIEVDAFLDKESVRLLFKIKEAFKADEVKLADCDKGRDEDAVETD
jgi:hypothetical protein